MYSHIKDLTEPKHSLWIDLKTDGVEENGPRFSPEVRVGKRRKEREKKAAFVLYLFTYMCVHATTQA